MTDQTPTDFTPPPRLLRLAEVRERVGLGRSTIYKWIGEGRFPRPVKMGTLDAWVESEISAWIGERVQVRDAAA